MITKIYAIYDSKASAYLQPFHAATNGLAIRSFTEACNDANTGFYKYPDDYTLFEIGSFDDNSGHYDNLPAKISLGNALQYKKQLTLSEPLPFNKTN